MIWRKAGSLFHGLCLLAGLASLSPAWAQTDPVSLPASAPAPARPAFDLTIEAPPDVADLLQRHLELQRYRELTDLDDSELRRLLTAADRNARELLGTLGYFSPTLTFTQKEAVPPAATSRQILLRVDPGEPARISDVSLSFTGPISDDDAARGQRAAIRASWSLRQGMPFSQSEWDVAKSQALRQLTERRYPAGVLHASLAEVDAQARTVRLSVTFDSGPLYRLGELNIQGTQRYDAAMVTRLARLAPGAEYRQSELLEAQQRLADSGYFDAVFVSLDTTGDPGAAPVRVELREARLQKLVLGLGASTDSGARLSVEHTHHRLPWLGWRAVSRMSLDRETKSLGTELTAPPDAQHWRWVTSALLQDEQAASFRVNSQRWRLGRSQSGERIDRNYYLQYDRARSTSDSVVTQADALSVNYAWTQRNFDSLPFPAQGYGLGVELGGGVTLGSERQPFARVLGRWLAYWPLARSERSQRPLPRAGRVAVRAEAGAVLARTGATLPNTQLFLTGGDTTVRGYGLRDIGVQLPTGDTTAGRYLAVGSVEWQRPMVVNDRLTAWEGTLFLDAGAVANQPADLRAKLGVGAGVRWKSPVGPLQMDLAYGVAVKKFRLHLNVGFTF